MVVNESQFVTVKSDGKVVDTLKGPTWLPPFPVRVYAPPAIVPPVGAKPYIEPRGVSEAPIAAPGGKLGPLRGSRAPASSARSGAPGSAAFLGKVLSYTRQYSNVGPPCDRIHSLAV